MITMTMSTSCVDAGVLLLTVYRPPPRAGPRENPTPTEVSMKP